MSNWTKDKIESSPLTALATIDGQEKVIKALRDELEAVKAGMNKVKADAITRFIVAIEGAIENDIISDREAEEMDICDFLNLAYKHANQVEKGQ